MDFLFCTKPCKVPNLSNRPTLVLSFFNFSNMFCNKKSPVVDLCPGQWQQIGINQCIKKVSHLSFEVKDFKEQPAVGVFGNIVIPSNRKHGLCLQKGRVHPDSGSRPLISKSDARDVVSRVLQTSPIHLIYGPSLDKCTSYIWVQLDDSDEM